MASPEQLREAERLEKEALDLNMRYAELKDNPAMLDLLGSLDASYDAAHLAALSEVENGTRAIAALQQANAYDTIRSYIKSKMV
jgi:hypothetical protein